MKELRHFNRVMHWGPANIGPDVLLQLLHQGMQVHVQLEPGDGTRYDLLLTWLPAVRTAFHLGDEARDGLLVTRVVGGQVVGSAVYGWFSYGAIARIANGNEWSAELLSWWLDELLERVAAASIGVAS